MTGWRLIVGALGIGATVLGGVYAFSGGREQDTGRAAAGGQRPYTPHGYPLDDDHYLRWALPAGEEAYGRIVGQRLKARVEQITAISRRSRDDGERFWGRISGTKYDHMTEQLVEDAFREMGLQNIRRQWFDLPTQRFPTSWGMTATGGGRTLDLQTVQPARESAAAPSGGLELEPVWVGLGTEADFKGRDVRGKLVVIQSQPTPGAINNSAGWNGANLRASQKGAAALLVSLAVPGNLQYQMWVRGGPIPSFSIGTEDLTALRQLMETASDVTVKLHLDVEERTGLRDASVWGELPGTSDEDIIIMAHHDAYFEGALDNASGMSVMLGLAEYFAKIPQSQRRRTLKFVSTSGHHNGSLGTKWMSDNKATFLAKTALMINCEHVSVTQTYLWGPNLRKSNQTDARRWWVFGSPALANLVLDAYRTFGVAVYHEMEPNASGDMGHVSRDAPSIQMIESPNFYHSDHDRPDIVPASGLEAVARAFAKIIDQVNRLDRRDILPVNPTTN
jgi:hypothetical protein